TTPFATSGDEKIAPIANCRSADTSGASRRWDALIPFPGKISNGVDPVSLFNLAVLAVRIAKRLRQFRRQQRRRAIMRRDICAKSTGDFQDALSIDSARESNHESCHERITRADRVLYFDVRRRCGR